MTRKAVLGDEERKKEILDAALYCFLQFGYSKTSMDDVAKQADLSRPLLYLKFKNKEDLFQGIFDYTLAGSYDETEKVLYQNISPKEKLIRVCELNLIEPWAKIEGRPKTAEFYETCSKLSPESTQKYEKQIVKFAERILGDKKTAEVFFLALEGLSADLPKTKVLRKRVELLCERFSR
ncbi:TetR/AcrR family transcriptional regulator [Leptospira neocaledonica]|uniref:TetR family transcriptional regulator n=1 Tax=Leptospira neocaledonica TaxID=2023192 RepID=A0A2N0A428_9LEPT|nr:TetR/AcrR family transcriptional regulator [Leptospira neocaledonica]PJZ79070.1 TetR family transcriptional regulator [Leptospira neocaledonica]